MMIRLVEKTLGLILAVVDFLHWLDEPEGMSPEQAAEAEAVRRSVNWNS